MVQYTWCIAKTEKVGGAPEVEMKGVELKHFLSCRIIVGGWKVQMEFANTLEKSKVNYWFSSNWSMINCDTYIK